MPTYEITAPDGKVLEITAPDGATQEQVLAYAQAQYKSPAAQEPASQPDPTAGMSTMDKLRAGFAKSFVDTARGARQLGTTSLRNQTALAGNVLRGVGMDGAANFVGRQITAPLARQGAEIQRDVDQSRELDAPLMRTGAGLAGNVAGSVAQTALIPGAGATLPGRFGVAAAQGGAFAGAQPVATGETRAGNAAMGAGFGVAGQGVASVAGRAGKGLSDKLSPHVLAVYQRAQQAGIPVHFSQLSDSKFVKTLASAVGYLPFSGSASKAAQQQQAFNSAVGRSFGADDAANLSDEVMHGVRQRLGASYDDIYSRNVVKADDELLDDLAAIEQSAMRNLPPDERVVVKNQIDDILNAAGNEGMPGAQYQAFRTDRLLPLEGGQKTFQAGLIQNIRKSLDRAAERSVGPDDAKALAITRRQYRNMKTAEKAMGQVEGSKGNVRPASLWPIVNQKGGATPEMRELARIGQAIKDPIPDSGTAGRVLVYGALGAGGANDMRDGQLSEIGKLLLLGMTAGRAVNSKTVANYLARGNKPIEGLARVLQRTAPRALPGAGMPLTVAGGRVATPEEIAADEELVRRFREGR